MSIYCRHFYQQILAATSCGALIAPSAPTSIAVRALSASTSLLGSETRRQKAELFRQRLRDRIADVKDNIKTIPNALCIARICSTPLIGYLVVHEHFMPACALFVVSGVTDLLDGWIARRYPSQRSILGSMLDPLADKLLISTLVVTLTYVQLIPLALAVLILGRDVLLIAGGFVRRYQMLEPPVTISRFFNPSVSSVRVTPTFASKVNTALQFGLVSLSLASPVFDFQDHPLLTALCVCTGATTVYSGLQYATGSAMTPIRKIVERVERRRKST